VVASAEGYLALARDDDPSDAGLYYSAEGTSWSRTSDAQGDEFAGANLFAADLEVGERDLIAAADGFTRAGIVEWRGR
jgi:hypothetical protein